MQKEEYLTEITREALIQEIREVYNKLRYKIENQRIKSPENEKIRNIQYKILISMARTMNDLLRDQQLDEIKNELELFKQLLNNPNSVPMAINNANDSKVKLLVSKIEEL